MKHSPVKMDKSFTSQYHLLSAFIIIFYLVISLFTKKISDTFVVIFLVGLVFVLIEKYLSRGCFICLHRLSVLNHQLQQAISGICPYLIISLSLIFVESYLFNYSIVWLCKSIALILTMGCFASIGIILEFEYQKIKKQIPVEVTNISKITPIGLKSRYFISIISALCFLNFIGVLHFYLESSDSFFSIQQNFYEFLLISAAIIIWSIYLFYLYNRNFACLLDMQVSVLRRIEEGSFDINMPVVSNDEFGLLASYYNAMLSSLRDRDQLYKTLEKSVGSNVMNKLLTTDEETLKHGQTHEVAILFCDLRGFSNLGESAAAEEIILFLNIYFADISSVISNHNGIINKFMGDAVLAIFGLESEGNPVEDAVNAAIEITTHGIDLYMPDNRHPETGVGIDFGSVIAGTIGSDERYEYTIIGDAVNKASRLEGLSKRLSYSIILSEDAYRTLSPSMASSFEDLDSHNVRGRTEPIHVYGRGKKQKTTPS